MAVLEIKPHMPHLQLSQQFSLFQHYDAQSHTSTLNNIFQQIKEHASLFIKNCYSALMFAQVSPNLPSMLHLSWHSYFMPF